MTPQPPSSPEDPAHPPGPRREKDPAAARSLEPNLWDLDAQMELDSPPAPEPEPAKDRESEDIEDSGKTKPAPEPIAIEPRSTAKKAARTSPEKTAKPERSPKTKPARPQKSGPPSPEKLSSTKLSSDFDDLEPDLWEEPESAPPPAEAALPAIAPPEVPPETAAAEPPPEPPSDTPGATTPHAAGATNLSHLTRPLLTLNRLEKIGLAALLAILLIGTALILGHWLTRLPTESIKAQRADFPIEGERVTAVSAETYWRVPITEGPDADRFRRGTQLLPVAELAFRGGPAAVRVFFRNDANQLVGDAVTRAISGNTSMTIAATAGFDDLGMHAAYRTGERKFWVVQILEGPSVNAPSAEFKLLFETTISSERR